MPDSSKDSRKRLEKKLELLYEQRDLETRVEEIMRIDAVIKRTQSDIEALENGTAFIELDKENHSLISILGGLGGAIGGLFALIAVIMTVVNPLLAPLLGKEQYQWLLVWEVAFFVVSLVGERAVSMAAGMGSGFFRGVTALVSGFGFSKSTTG